MAANDGKQDRVAQEERAEKLKQGKRRVSWLSRAIIMMALIYYADFLMIDSFVYGSVGFIDAMFDGNPWLPAVKSSLGTIKFLGFGGIASFAYYVSQQGSAGR